MTTINTIGGDHLMEDAAQAVLLHTWRQGVDGIGDIGLAMIELIDEEYLRRMALVCADIGSVVSAELLVRSARTTNGELYLDYPDHEQISDDPDLGDYQIPQIGVD